MLRRVWRFQDSEIEELYSKRSRGTLWGPSEEHPPPSITRARSVVSTGMLSQRGSIRRFRIISARVARRKRLLLFGKVAAPVARGLRSKGWKLCTVAKDRG